MRPRCRPRRKDGRVVYCVGLENRSTERYRGFESLSFRKKVREDTKNEKEEAGKVSSFLFLVDSRDSLQGIGITQESLTFSIRRQTVGITQKSLSFLPHPNLSRFRTSTEVERSMFRTSFGAILDLILFYALATSTFSVIYLQYSVIQNFAIFALFGQFC